MKIESYNEPQIKEETVDWLFKVTKEEKNSGESVREEEK